MAVPPSLREWRAILADGAMLALSVPEAGFRFECLPYPAAKLPAVRPCGMIAQGGPSGPYTDSTGDSDVGTAGQVAARFTLWIAAGAQLTEAAADVLDELVARLHADALAVCGSHPANTAGFIPVVEQVGTPAITPFGGDEVWAAPVELVVPASL